MFNTILIEIENNSSLTIEIPGGTSMFDTAFYIYNSKLCLILYNNTHLKIIGQNSATSGILIAEGGFLSCIDVSSSTKPSDITVENVNYGLRNYGYSILPYHITGASVSEYLHSAKSAVTAIAGKWVDQA